MDDIANAPFGMNESVALMSSLSNMSIETMQFLEDGQCPSDAASQETNEVASQGATSPTTGVPDAEGFIRGEGHEGEDTSHAALLLAHTGNVT